MKSSFYLFVVVSFLITSNYSFSQNTVGVTKIDSARASEDYMLFSPMGQTNTYLIDRYGQKIKEWESEYVTGHTFYLDNSGNLYRAGQFQTNSPLKSGPGGGGIIQKFDWNNNILWQHTFSSDTSRHHHDFEVLPNGNIILAVWELKTADEAYANGRLDGTLEDNELWPEGLYEIKPIGSNDMEIVWEWHVWDHIIQDEFPDKPNYGNVAEHPEKINLNYFTHPRKSWNHFNSIDYDVDKNQIILSVHGFSEFWILDHTTTTGEAAGSSGGQYGKGGDLLFRYGNPQTYDKGTADDQILFSQHNVDLIQDGVPYAGNYIMFNNGEFRPSDVDYSSIEIVNVNDFELNGSGLFGNANVEYTYIGDPLTDFFSLRFSSARILNNGNLLICEGATGTLFEVDLQTEDIVWEYINPVSSTGSLNQGDEPLGNSVFQALKYGSDFPGFEGKDLEANGFLEIYPETVTNNKGKVLVQSKIYPNPVKDLLSIDLAEGETVELKLYDFSSKLVFDKKISKTDKLDISHLSNGFYFVFLNDEYVLKLLKN